MLTCSFKHLHAVCHVNLTPFKGGIGVAKLGISLIEFSDGLALGCHNGGRRGKDGDSEREREGEAWIGQTRRMASSGSGGDVIAPWNAALNRNSLAAVISVPHLFQYM
jgi:hypothetical protein